VLTVVVLLLVGVAAGNLRWLPEGTGSLLDLLVIRLALPGLVLTVVPSLARSTPRSSSRCWSPGAPRCCSPRRCWRGAGSAARRRHDGDLLLVVPLGNTSFLGFPAVEALLGTDHLPAAVIYDQLGSFLALATYGGYVASRYGTGPPPGPASSFAGS
jgi:malate permease and related proteins